MDVLRKSKTGTQETWTKEQILAGLHHFFELYGRYPTALEIDSYEYLPSSRSIQRSFGGLVALRKELIPGSQSNYTQGEYRSVVAKKTWDRAVKYEEEFYDFLTAHFKAVAIHEHKIIRPGNIASDFYIYYTDKKGVVIDLFYAQDAFSLIGIVNIKLKRYKSLPYDIYFILVGNEGLDFQKVSQIMARRKVTLPSNILIDTERHFKESTVFEIKQQSIFAI